MFAVRSLGGNAWRARRGGKAAKGGSCLWPGFLFFFFFSFFFGIAVECLNGSLRRRLLLNEVVVTAPTIGSNVEEVQFRNIKFVMWDLGGQESSRASWATYYKQTNAIILVIDSTDRDRVGLIKAELDRMLQNDSLKTAVLLLFANKQDVKGAMTVAEISDALTLHNIKDHGWHIQESCALTGFGLTEGMDWIANNINK